MSCLYKIDNEYTRVAGTPFGELYNDYLQDQQRMSDWEPLSFNAGANAYICPYDGFIAATTSSAVNHWIKVVFDAIPDSYIAAGSFNRSQSNTDSTPASTTFYVHKGDALTVTINGTVNVYGKWYKDRDYSDRQ